jgi:tetratricopeptide (TPR) repeat protein
MLMLPFRPITRGRLRRARLTALILAGVTLAIFLLTLTRCAFPGESARWIAWVSGLDAREVPARPLLAALGQAVSRLDFLTLPLRLNALCALAGALAVAWIYRLVWFFIFDTMREQSASEHASRLARFGGGVAALAAGLSLPFWQAATRFRPEIFDVALLLGSAQLLLVYARTARLAWLLLFGAVYGAGAAESPLLLVAAPFMLVAATLVEWRLFWCQMRRLEAGAVVAAAAFLATHYLGARVFGLAQGLPVDSRGILRLVVSVLHSQFSVIKGMLPAYLWIPVLALGLGTAALAILSSVRALDNRRSWGLVILNTCLTLSVGLLLGNVPFSPWGVAAARGALPVATYVLAGIGIGLLAASWRALYVMANPEEGIVHWEERAGENEPAPVPRSFAACRFAGYLLAPALAAAVVIGGIVNGVRNRLDDGAFADRAADAILDRLHGRYWVVGNGALDAHLQIRAYERHLPLLLFAPQRAMESSYTRFVLRAVRRDPGFSPQARQRAETLIPYNFNVFIEDLFASDPAIASKAVCVAIPDLWYGSNWTPLPECLFYGGVRDLAVACRDRDLAGEHRAFWNAWGPFLRQRPDFPRRLSADPARNGLRRHLAFVANNLGVALDDTGKQEEAFQAYQQARTMDPENISALLNQFELVSRGFHPELKSAVETDLRRRVETSSQRYTYWALSRYHGYVRNSELFLQMGWTWTLSSSPGSVLAGLRSAYGVEQDLGKRARLASMMATLYEKRGDMVQSAAEYRKALAINPRDASAISGLARISLWQNVVDEARRVLEAGENAGASKRLLRQDWAALYLVSGDLPRARILLQEMADDTDASPMVLAMLAMVMIEQNEIKAVETGVLPRLSKAAGKGPNAYFPLVVEGRVWQSKGRPGLRNARLCFHRAAALRPDVEALQDVIFSLDVALEDQSAAEAHALLILRRRPDNPFANLVIGSIRLEEGQYEQAEPFLRRSAAQNPPSLEALNNLAQVLVRLGRVPEAERIAAQATARAPERYEGWSTLALVQILAGKLDEAAASLARSRALNASDRRLFLIEGLLAARRGDAVAAEQALKSLGAETALGVVDRRDLDGLKAEIARLRRPPAPPAR